MRLALLFAIALLSTPLVAQTPPAAPGDDLDHIALNDDIDAVPAGPPGPKPPPVVIPPPSAAERKKVFEFLKEYAANYAKSLPNFLCKQVTRRYEDKSGTEFWGLRDTVIASLSFNEGKEDYKVQLINNHAVMDTPFEKLGGFQTRGEFGSWMRDIFDPESGATFDWDRWATLGFESYSAIRHVFACRRGGAAAGRRLQHAANGGSSSVRPAAGGFGQLRPRVI